VGLASQCLHLSEARQNTRTCTRRAQGLFTVTIILHKVSQQTSRDKTAYTTAYLPARLLPAINIHMAPRTAASHRAAESESEDDLAAAAAISSVENRRAAQNTLTATKFGKATRRNSTTKAPTKRKAPAAKQSRQALKDRTNHPESDNEDQDNADGAEMEHEEPKPKAKRARTTAATKKKAATRAATEAGAVEEAEPAPVAKKTRAKKRAPSPEPPRVIPETQQDPEQMEDVSHTIEEPDEMVVEPAPVARQPNGHSSRQRSTSVQPPQPRASARSVSAQPGRPAPRERSGSVSGTERERRGGDPELRRKLNDMTRKHENLSLKYENLQEVGEKSAKANFDKLKRATDEKAKSAADLIASLKKELAEARKSTKVDTTESTALQKQVTSLTASNEKLASENKELMTKAQTAQSDIKAAQNEVKSMEAKLAAARAEVTAQEAKAKGAAAARNVPVNTSEAQKEAKMRENLYSDLTGLIIRNVKRKDGEDEFDCLQTGRNGSKYISELLDNGHVLIAATALHFHLTVANDTTSSAPKTPSGSAYEEAEFTYEPLLDESRDNELIEILPDYLTEDIEFPRHQALKFYHKMLESMMKRIMVEEE